MRYMLLSALLFACPHLSMAIGGHGCAHAHGVSHAHSGHISTRGYSHSYHPWTYNSHSGHSGGGDGRYGRYGSSGDAKDPRQGIDEFEVSPGLISLLQFADGNTAKYATPVYTGAYRYYVSDHLALGVAAATQTIAGRDTCSCTTGTNPLLYNYSSRSLAVVGSMNIILATHKNYQAYMGIDIGVNMIRENDRFDDNTSNNFTEYKLTGQATLLGIRAGHALGGFVAFGVGYKGLVCMGLSYQAGWKQAHHNMW